MVMMFGQRFDPAQVHPKGGLFKTSFFYNLPALI